MSRLPSLFSAPVLLLLLVSDRALTTPTPTVSQRDTTAVFYGTNDFRHAYGWDNLGPCSLAYGVSPGCAMATDNSTWTAMTYSWFPNNWEYVWAPDDTTVANCLINLHYKQDDVCISVKGSECESKKGTSRILNARSTHRLSADSSNSLQAASNALVGVKVNSNNDGLQQPGVFLNHIDREKVGEEHGSSSIGDVSIHFGGDEQC